MPTRLLLYLPGHFESRTRDIDEVGRQRIDENMLEMEVEEETRKWLI